MRPFLLASLSVALLGAAPVPTDLGRWQTQAARVSITRDDWGIAHVRGRSDADAVFGAIYAQAEDDFPRIEANYLTALGRTAEAEGEAAIWADLRQRLWIDPIALQAEYRRSPPWLRVLMDAWADGLNFYLARHPTEKPRVLTRFEPWMALSFTEGSIGGDIEKVDLARLAAFYGTPAPQLARVAEVDAEPRGSNGIAIGPKLSANGRPLLLVNPHTSFFFRSELQMTSDAGLNAYGASTWGQFFIYQGWNDRVGWMHTTSGVDAVDEFALDVTRRGPDLITYRFGRENRPLEVSSVRLKFRKPDGSLGERNFLTWRSQHGPVTHKIGAKWISTALMHRPVPALEQSWLRTRARSYPEFLRVAGRQANSSNNTVYADADGHTALLLPQFVPLRDDRFDYRRPVNGSDPATAWRGLTPLAKLPAVTDPAGRWLYNANDAPWRAAGAGSPRANAYPRYMDQAGANPRGDHAIALLGKARALDWQGLRAIAYDPWLSAFAGLIPQLISVREYTADPAAAERLREPIAALTRWDQRAAANSTATTLAMFWADEMWPEAVSNQRPPELTPWRWLETGMPAGAKLAALERAVARLKRDFGRWDVPWGEVNRFQRNDAAIVQRFDDAKPSLPVPFASARWGSLASFGARAYPGTRRWYGTSGNSFVAIVEFGPRVRAWAVTAGGESGRPGSPHFANQAKRYAAGDLRPVYFWPDELAGHVERRYRPGE
ncbi:penicillin acylase family protein [Sphingomonas sp.]|jgi:acyl-homoserine-lactone acylase|uniref:penicillin acylase family protein n=1 Tax=Sphingomonas sp. TaxID=28214 RepID=UPI002D7FEA16|nr:penicillin acylase family protein [Sphingomonas sp.]HEU0043325.1 penicillin acylase family protein [Sphingomonas sp.]